MGKVPERKDRRQPEFNLDSFRTHQHGIFENCRVNIEFGSA